MSFLSLEEFLLLTNPCDLPGNAPRPAFHAHLTAEQWLVRYRIAKASFEKFGNSPPFGQKVHVLHNGFGNVDAGPLRILRGIAKDERFFELMVETGRFAAYPAVYWAERDHWWLHFMVTHPEWHKPLIPPNQKTATDYLFDFLNNRMYPCPVKDFHYE
jgi:hypothetical protein